MADNLSPEIRKKNMSAIRSVHTKLEDRVTKALWKHGIRFRKNVKGLKGKPDIAIQKYKIVIFIDSCFWHACEQHCRIPTSNVPYWTQKLYGNKQRDALVTKYYKNQGWHVLRVWEHDLKANFDGTIHSIAEFITAVMTYTGSKKRWEESE